MWSRSAAANESGEGAYDSDEDLWNSKLVIDEQANSNNTPDSADRNSWLPSKGHQLDASSSTKPKGRKCTQKKPDDISNKQFAESQQKSKISENKLSNSDQAEKAAPSKPGRKRKEAHMEHSRTTAGEVKNLLSDKEDGHCRLDKKELISSSAVVEKSPYRKKKSEAVATKDSSTEYDWRSVGCITEPENLGPCESGTQVNLEGIVWQETNNGVLIVNVTWRGKSYMGTLLDATKYDWSPPSCDSHVGEFDNRTPKGRGKRSRVPLCDTFKDINERKMRKEMKKQTGVAMLAKAETGKRRSANIDSDNLKPSAKRSCLVAQNGCRSDSQLGLIECPEPNCGKKYKQMNGLKYHQRNAHPESIINNADSTSDNEKLESITTAETADRKKLKVKTEITAAYPSLSDKHVSDKPVTDTARCMVAEPEGTLSTSINYNMVAAVASTTNSTQISNISQPSNVPVAAIMPQVIKPLSTAGDREQQKLNSTTLSPANNKSNQIPHKLLPKTNIACDSKVTTQEVCNPSFKTIQPKPKLLDATSSPKPFGNLKSTPQTNEQNPNGMVLDMTLKSPSTYSDISDEGERKGLSKADTSKSFNTMEPEMNPFLVAMVNPQQIDIKTDLGRDQKKQPENLRPPEDMKQGQYLDLIQQYFPFTGWPMTQEFLTTLMSKEKPQIAVSPQPNPVRSPSDFPYKTGELKASTERLKLLKENMNMKSLPSYLSATTSESPKDYSLSSGFKNTSEHSTNYINNAEKKPDQCKRDSITTLPTVYNTQASGKSVDMRTDLPKVSNISSKHRLMNPNSFPYDMSGLTKNTMIGDHGPLLSMAEKRDSQSIHSMSPSHHYRLESVKSSQSPRPSHLSDRSNAAKNGSFLQSSLQPALHMFGSVKPKI